MCSPNLRYRTATFVPLLHVISHGTFSILVSLERLLACLYHKCGMVTILSLWEKCLGVAFCNFCLCTKHDLHNCMYTLVNPSGPWQSQL